MDPSFPGSVNSLVVKPTQSVSNPCVHSTNLPVTGRWQKPWKGHLCSGNSIFAVLRNASYRSPHNSSVIFSTTVRVWHACVPGGLLNIPRPLRWYFLGFSWKLAAENKAISIIGEVIFPTEWEIMIQKSEWWLLTSVAPVIRRMNCSELSASSHRSKNLQPNPTIISTFKTGGHLLAATPWQG